MQDLPYLSKKVLCLSFEIHRKLNLRICKMFNMNVLILLLILLPLSGYSKKPDIYKKVYYFYDEDKVFHKEESKGDIWFTIRKPHWFPPLLYNPSVDSRFPTLYYLIYKKGDLVFAKHKSYLSKIEYFNSRWLNNETNLRYFWRLPEEDKNHRGVLKIYMIEKIENTDSLLFRCVIRRVLGSE